MAQNDCSTAKEKVRELSIVWIPKIRPFRALKKAREEIGLASYPQIVLAAWNQERLRERANVG